MVRCATGYEYAGRTFPGYAEFHSYGEKYVLVKSAKLWEVDTHEYLFFVLADALDETQVRDLVSFMEHDGLKKVVPKPNHMSSAISLVIVADSCTQEAAKAVKAAITLDDKAPQSTPTVYRRITE